jgi:site-specific DNA recombinase
VPAGEIERFVVEQIKRVGQDPAVLEGTLRQMRQQNAKVIADLETQQKVVQRELVRHAAALRKLVAMPGAPDPNRLAEINDAVRLAEQKAAGLQEQVEKVKREAIDPREVASALSAFDPVWEQLAPKEQARVIQLLVERIEYDGAAGTVSVTFHPTGLKAMAKEQGHEVAA